MSKFSSNLHPIRGSRSHRFRKLTIAGAIVLSCSAAAQIVSDLDSKVKSNPSQAATDGKLAKGQAVSSEIKLEKLTHPQLIALLANEKYETRERVYEFIWRLGKPMIPSLEKGRASKNPEVAQRSRLLWRNIKIGVTVDTPKHIAQKVEEFQTALLDRQEDILSDLYGEQAFNQMLFMLSEMENRESAGKLYKKFSNLGHIAAQQALGKGDVEAAIELLKLAPQDASIKRSLAFIYARTGRARAELLLLQKQPVNKADQTWHLALLQEIGDVKLLQDYARKQNDYDLQASLGLLKGDPEDVVSLLNKHSSTSTKTGQQILSNIYNGVTGSENSVLRVRLLEQAKASARRKDFTAVNLLFSTGGEEVAESVLLKNSPNKGFEYLIRRDRLVDALAVYGIHDDASLKAWVAKTMRNIAAEKKDPFGEEESDFTSNEAKLFIVAKLYMGNGEKEKAKSIIKPLLDHCFKANFEQWESIISDLPRFEMHELTLEFILEKDNDVIQDMVRILFDGSPEVDLIWRKLTERRGTTVKQSFKDLGVIMGMYRDIGTKRLALEQELLKSAKLVGAEDYSSMLFSLSTVADYRHDSIAVKDYVGKLFLTDRVKDKESQFIQEKLTAASLNLDWKEIDKLLTEHPDLAENLPDWKMIHSIALSKLGKKREADKMFENAVLLTLGRAPEMYEIMYQLSLVSEHERLFELQKRLYLVNSSNVGSVKFQVAVAELGSETSHYVMTNQWKKASAFTFVNASYEATRVSRTMFSSVSIFNRLHTFSKLQYTRAMYFYKQGDKKKALALLAGAHQTLVGDGYLADNFFPLARTTTFKKEYNGWVKASHDHLNSAISAFPKSANLRNTLAWVLSRSNRNLDEALKHSQVSLKLHPNEAAYLDTLGETYFSMGKRDEAIKWGERAVLSSKSGQLVGKASQTMTRARTHSLYGQLERFRSEPLPK